MEAAGTIGDASFSERLLRSYRLHTHPDLRHRVPVQGLDGRLCPGSELFPGDIWVQEVRQWLLVRRRTARRVVRGTRRAPVVLRARRRLVSGRARPLPLPPETAEKVSADGVWGPGSLAFNIYYPLMTLKDPPLGDAVLG